jgi:hypothetical protein
MCAVCPSRSLGVSVRVRARPRAGVRARARVCVCVCVCLGVCADLFLEPDHERMATGYICVRRCSMVRCASAASRSWVLLGIFPCPTDSSRVTEEELTHLALAGVTVIGRLFQKNRARTC